MLRSDGIVKTVEIAVRTAKGRKIWTAVTARLITEPDGREFLDGAFEDITEQRKATLDIEHAHARLFEVLEAAPVPMMMFGGDATLQIANRMWKEITGYHGGEIRTLEDWARIARLGDGPGVPFEALSAERDRLPAGDFEVRCAGGESRIWQVLSTRLMGRRDDEATLLCAAVDVTEDRVREQQFKLVDAVFRTLREGTMITDRNGKIARVNPAFTRITGYADHEVIGRDPKMLGSGRHDREFFQKMWSAIEKYDFWHGEVWNRRRDGTIFPQWLSISSIRDAGGSVSHYAGVFTDLTEIKQSQADLKPSTLPVHP